jgi:hypothetical protein
MVWNEMREPYKSDRIIDDRESVDADRSPQLSFGWMTGLMKFARRADIVSDVDDSALRPLC